MSLSSGLAILAGIGVEGIAARFAGRAWIKTVLGILLLAGCGHLGWQAYRAAFKFPADARNPYAYVHPGADVQRLGERIEALAHVHPDGVKMTVQVMAPKADYWPLPWYLRRLEGVGYWSVPPVKLDAPVIVAAPEFVGELRLELKDKYQVNAYGLRPGVLVWLYVEEGLWRRFLEEAGRR